MGLISAAIRVVPATADQDRALRIAHAECDIIVLADGAGGMTGGREAAERVLRHDFRAATGPTECAAELSRLDQQIHDDDACGETTSVVVIVREEKVFGASIGDSGAWALTSDAIVDLTQHQRRKPLLGSGAAEATAFGPFSFNDRILVASDGLLKYAPRDLLRRIGLGSDLELAADALVAAARLPGGTLQDDVALVLLEPQRSR